MGNTQKDIEMTGIGIVIIGGDDKNISAGAKKHGLSCCASNTPVVKYQKTLIVNAGTRVPWDLLPAAWNFLDRWDCAVPLWKYGVTANDIGTSDERKKTRDVIRDLRVLLYSHELLFVRKNTVGTEFIDIWNGEDGDRRLAFLRAYYTIKPVMCVLPTSWLAEILAKSKRYWVEIYDDFTLKGSIFAPGVKDADSDIRIGDEVVVKRKEKLCAVGVAQMNGDEMKESSHGEAVSIRHKI